ncbi:hypothetical protein Syun_020693 [Stephania yunnanensis]|uniref:Uncharacterized protein n=1 Tax=Stephania yunnanensis TaxID=152371 RepID=A0AAP0IFK5_9MAGN
MIWPHDCSILPASREIEWVSRNFKGDSLASYIGKIAFCATFHQIWIERNRRVFQNKKNEVNHLVKEISKTIKIKINGKHLAHFDSIINRFLSSKWSLSTRPIKETLYFWQPPPSGIIKLNTDGAFIQGKIYYGGVARNHEGQPLWVFAGGKVGDLPLRQNFMGSEWEY